MRLSLLCIVGACVFVGCASTFSGSSGRSSGAITQEEMTDSGLAFTDAHDIVRQLRPQWLFKRGRSTLSPGQGADADLLDFVAVYQDRLFLGDLDALRGMSVLSVMEIEYMDTARAQRLGSRSHIHGAIVVRTRSE